MMCGNPAIRDVREPDIHEWSVMDATGPGYVVLPPAVGGGNVGYRVRWRDVADALADALNTDDTLSPEQIEADYDAEAVPA
jgi:hypothetical protein